MQPFSRRAPGPKRALRQAMPRTGLPPRPPDELGESKRRLRPAPILGAVVALAAVGGLAGAAVAILGERSSGPAASPTVVVATEPPTPRTPQVAAEAQPTATASSPSPTPASPTPEPTRALPVATTGASAAAPPPVPATAESTSTRVAEEPTAASTPTPEEEAEAPVVEEPPPTPTPVPRPAPAPAPTRRTYTVRPGDELKQIAARYGVSMASILAINNIPNPDSLRVGQVLVIPNPSR